MNAITHLYEKVHGLSVLFSAEPYKLFSFHFFTFSKYFKNKFLKIAIANQKNRADLTIKEHNQKRNNGGGKSLVITQP